jgi:hypothetical protein
LWQGRGVKGCRIRYRSGKTAWQLDLGMVEQADGSRKRMQRYFETREEASAELAAAKSRRRTHGDAAFSLTEEERIRFTSARDQLADGGSLIDAAREYAERRRLPGSSMLPQQVVDEMLEA